MGSNSTPTTDPASTPESQRTSGYGAGAKAEDTDTTPEMLAEDWAKLITLISRYLTRSTGYIARRAVFESRFAGEYDHLARHGEWQMSDRAEPAPVGPEDTP